MPSQQVVFQVSSIASAFSQVTGIITGFAFAAIILLMESRRIIGRSVVSSFAVFLLEHFRLIPVLNSSGSHRQFSSKLHAFEHHGWYVCNGNADDAIQFPLHPRRSRSTPERRIPLSNLLRWYWAHPLSICQWPCGPNPESSLEPKP